VSYSIFKILWVSRKNLAYRTFMVVHWTLPSTNQCFISMIMSNWKFDRSLILFLSFCRITSAWELLQEEQQNEEVVSHRAELHCNLNFPFLRSVNITWVTCTLLTNDWMIKSKPEVLILCVIIWTDNNSILHTLMTYIRLEVYT
jgi:hypothetical protein